MIDDFQKVINPPKSTKTTASGVLGFIGVLLTASSHPVVHAVGIIVEAIAIPLMGYFARDNDKRSS